MIDRLLAILASVQTRIAAGVAMMVALATLLSPGNDWDFNLPTCLAFATAFFLWIGAELQSAIIRHPHDVRLAELLMQSMSIKERQLLRSMEFSEDFQWTDFPGLSLIGHTWDGPDFHFLDARLQRAWEPVLRAIVAFRVELARRSAPRRGAGDWYTVKTARMDRDGEEMSDQSRRDADYLNEASDKLTAQLDKFIVLAKRRLAL